jgi:hypothetical protein
MLWIRYGEYALAINNTMYICKATHYKIKPLTGGEVIERSKDKAGEILIRSYQDLLNRYGCSQSSSIPLLSVYQELEAFITKNKSLINPDTSSLLTKVIEDIAHGNKKEIINKAINNIERQYPTIDNYPIRDVFTIFFPNQLGLMFIRESAFVIGWDGKILLKERFTLNNIQLVFTFFTYPMSKIYKELTIAHYSNLAKLYSELDKLKDKKGIELLDKIEVVTAPQILNIELPFKLMLDNLSGLTNLIT